MRLSRREASAVARRPASFSRSMSADSTARGLGSPATIASSDAPAAPASAAAEPPPGVGSEERNAASSPETVASVSLIEFTCQCVACGPAILAGSSDDAAALDHGCYRRRSHSDQVDRLAPDDHGIGEFAGFEAPD